MASVPPKRRFAPVPVETSVKSSKQAKSDQQSNGTTNGNAPRKFAVEPVETTVRHGRHNEEDPQGQDTSQHQQATSEPKAPRRFAVQPVEMTSSSSRGKNEKKPPSDEPPAQTKAPRRFAVQPVETSSKSNKKSAEETDKPKPARKFAVQPVETSSKSNKKQPEDDFTPKAPRKFNVQPVETSERNNHEEDGKPKSRFAPQPVETTVSRRKRSSNKPMRRDSELDETPADLPSIAVIKSPSRKFEPQLIDRSSRSRRAADGSIPMPHKFRTDVTPSHTINADGEPVFNGVPPRRRSPLPHERRKERTGSTHGNVRSHSFLCPDLETIESSESEVSESGSPARSNSSSTSNDSPLTTSDGISDGYKNAARNRESVDESFTQYMLSLEAKRAEQKLREQALAAFPNSDYHEPVEHYVDDEDQDGSVVDIDDRPATWEGHDEDDEFPLPKSSRKETTKIDWDLVDMQKHHEQLERSREDARKPSEQGPSPWWNPAAGVRDFAVQPDSEMSQMLNRARPPMLGEDIKFPRSQSPEPARFDITQGSHVLRSQMCYLTEQAEAKNNEPKTKNGLWGGLSSPDRSRSSEKGLWGGFCSANTAEAFGSHITAAPTGLMTPGVFEPANPFDETLSPSKPTGTHLRPPTPPHTRTKMLQSGIVVPKVNAMLNTDEELDGLMQTEYPDSFITQVFNYLSLGYPTLARPFDQELAKITGVTVADLRKDDSLAKSMPKGYIRIGDDFEGRQDGTSQDLEHNKCARWKALKVYVKEWARQEKGMVQVQTTPWGAAARKGSWAW